MSCISVDCTPVGLTLEKNDWRNSRSTLRQKETKREKRERKEREERKKKEKEKLREKRREKGRKGERKARKKRKRCPGSIIINLHSIRKKEN